MSKLERRILRDEILVDRRHPKHQPSLGEAIKRGFNGLRNIYINIDKFYDGLNTFLGSASKVDPNRGKRAYGRLHRFYGGLSNSLRDIKGIEKK